MPPARRRPRGPGRPRADRASGLDPEAIARAALALIDREGLDDFSLRKLAAALGCQPMSLYHHVPSKGALLDLVAAHLIAQVRVPATGAWRPRLAAVARAYLGVAADHPRAAVLMVTRRFNLPSQLAFLEQVLGLLRDSGLDAAHAAMAFRQLGFFLNGAAMALVSLRGEQPDATPSAVDRIAPELPPRVAASARYLAAPHFDAHVARGLEIVLDGIAALPRG
ncbi:MAG: TetR/AcrR family transcriptional regulator C-terminal domain-containing protein [Deltaproteobacteria bacterium]|nr:TetR/AcrR family transcriptional regulator C-terminal domain-containing protein [Deltaproteobacteria bacterium]